LAAERIPAGRDQLAPVLRAPLGDRRQLRRVTRLPGGSKKGVYRAVFDDESTAIVYIWAAGENYWPASSADACSDPAPVLARLRPEPVPGRAGAAAALLAPALPRYRR